MALVSYSQSKWFNRFSLSFQHFEKSIWDCINRHQMPFLISQSLLEHNEIKYLCDDSYNWTITSPGLFSSLFILSPQEWTRWLTVSCIWIICYTENQPIPPINHIKSRNQILITLLEGKCVHRRGSPNQHGLLNWYHVFASMSLVRQ